MFKQLPYLFPPVLPLKKQRYSKSLRRTIKLDGGKNEFEKILFNQIPKNIPRNYIEGYQDFKNISLKKYPKTQNYLHRKCP